ncbi:rRNA adenine methyltransferase [Streptomyces rapamycinicus NRRL 5491]|uniref:rRNA adenine methyltransferase n=2 Tax=Streptomyces rapamycinicus TaxID=1226757 RepID=A0A0A0NBR7_STRRN|nr:ErmE/ErmH/ErmO/ErmR family 23S rRNA (adenine(2058)-N(6))-methyltransferase [Streptomyces rapamycinicus]AGP54389.1 rRNA adenine methyltransferase [Streptomyces rapamycinicus NRRL 5491]MBB4781893.1 23S rRNA (adenine-N6)-dimethyltransferase [Streptomyces rapamycinicus]RLV73465.1 rRNA adenine methyltransferase [Streptomyces rapamycinicus NRRL 5491]UTO62449.1 ErmE/ErmH/ErmO/ErmR family 23S rRNA (adenine(2058)-N(6))-methyltransferase [Streptomyces rapamycinicus]UTP30405.1 ErmE/ErmH/ErmO/ErmR fami
MARNRRHPHAPRGGEPRRNTEAPRTEAPRADPRRSERDRARRAYGQNFLIDPGAVARVVRAARPGPGDLLVEVGAGKGALTEALAPCCRELISYEIDRHLIPGLRERLARCPRVRIVHQDFLEAAPPPEPFALVGNVPYARTAEIVAWALRAVPRLTSATLLTQAEYARKRTGDYGRWSLLTVRSWPEVEWRLCGRVARAAFRPVPAVDGGILRLTRRPRPLLTDPVARSVYADLVELGFTGVGGSLHASLRRVCPARALDRAFRAAGLGRDVVVAYVTPEQWLVLAQELTEVAAGMRSSAASKELMVRVKSRVDSRNL